MCCSTVHCSIPPQGFRCHCLSEALDLTRRYACEPPVLIQIVWGTKARPHRVVNTDGCVIMQNLTIS